MNEEQFEELMASVREADKILGPHVSACHRLIQSDPYYDKWMEAAKRYIERRAAGAPEAADALDSFRRLGMEAVDRAFSRYFASFKKGDKP